jgi:hypothetical protein
MKRRRFPVMLDPDERCALRALAQRDGLSGSAFVRNLIRQEARRRGLWPPPNHPAPHPQQESSHDPH